MGQTIVTNGSIIPLVKRTFDPIYSDLFVYAPVLITCHIFCLELAKRILCLLYILIIYRERNFPSALYTDLPQNNSFRICRKYSSSYSFLSNRVDHHSNPHLVHCWSIQWTLVPKPLVLTSWDFCTKITWLYPDFDILGSLLELGAEQDRPCGFAYEAKII